MIKNKTSGKNVLLANTVGLRQCYSINTRWFPMVQFVGIVSSCKVSIKQERCLFFRNAQLLYDLASQGLKERKNMLYEVFKAKIS